MGQFYPYIIICPAMLILAGFALFFMFRTMHGKSIPELTEKPLIMLGMLYVTLVIAFAMLAVMLIAWIIQNTHALD